MLMSRQPGRMRGGRNLRDVLAMVRNTSNPQVEYMVRVISKWAASSGIKIS